MLFILAVVSIVRADITVMVDWAYNARLLVFIVVLFWGILNTHKQRPEITVMVDSA